MPNWCYNKLRVSGEPTQLKDFVDTSMSSGEFSLHPLHPMPDELRSTTSPNTYDGKDEDAKAKHAIEVNRLKKAYGYDNWYDWAVNNWGTKWDVCECSVNENDSNCFEVEFNSAWSPPILWMGKVAPLFKDLSFEMYFSEPGMNFCGSYLWDNVNEFEFNECELMYTDDEDREVKWDGDFYRYTDTGEKIEDDDFFPLPKNPFEK